MYLINTRLGISKLYQPLDLLEYYILHTTKLCCILIVVAANGLGLKERSAVCPGVTKSELLSIVVFIKVEPVKLNPPTPYPGAVSAVSVVPYPGDQSE